jgi:hypothetical protein
MRLLLVLALWAAAMPAKALPAPLALAGNRLEAASCGVRSTLWIEHYAARLYLRDGAGPDAVSDPAEPKALRLRIINSFLLPPQIPSRWRNALGSVLDAAAMASLGAAYRDLESGDIVLITYVPRHGLTLRVNGAPVLGSDGQDAIDALLATWADEMPAEAQLRRTVADKTCR